ncbi:hypothetical protein L1987_01819 [Smallanthus sonchifolius]|uniref:Uncharacterized protein n=1 Tax=Smallanthus sonchifolius TaxID=185202 RepID=A0ACB9K639_9ASTR|nr:hypothetical protein L1987_01819 [Smallanthus sonchifolius]
MVNKHVHWVEHTNAITIKRLDDLFTSLVVVMPLVESSEHHKQLQGTMEEASSRGKRLRPPNSSSSSTSIPPSPPTPPSSLDSPAPEPVPAEPAGDLHPWLVFDP